MNMLWAGVRDVYLNFNTFKQQLFKGFIISQDFIYDVKL